MGLERSSIREGGVGRGDQGPLSQAITRTVVSEGRATALRPVHGAPEEEAERFHAVGHGYVPEAAAGYLPRISEGGSFPPVLQMGAAVGQPPQPVEATQEQPQEQICRGTSAADPTISQMVSQAHAKDSASQGARGFRRGSWGAGSPATRSKVWAVSAERAVQL